MNKSDLIREAVRRAGINVRQAGRGVEATLDVIARELGLRGEISIEGLGRIRLKVTRGELLLPVDSAETGDRETDSYKIQFGFDVAQSDCLRAPQKHDNLGNSQANSLRHFSGGD
ncbi:MAG: HU family DNA-binding protein, partial [Acidobacteriota bacterium]